jgi:RTA1 like protein
MVGIATIVETLNGNRVSYWSNIKNSGGKQSMCKRFLKAALVLQLVVLICFLSLTGYFHYQCKKRDPFPKNVRGVLITLYCSSVLIGIRAIYRTVEYYTISTFRYTPATSSSASPIIREEVFFWVFEALLMLANSFLFNLRNPMRFLPRDFKVYLAEDGITEVEGPGYLDLRCLLIAMVDPFDFMGLAMGRHLKRDFWKTDAKLKEQGERTVTREGVSDNQSDVEKAMGANTNGGSPAVEENALKDAVRVDTSGVRVGARNGEG